VEHVAATLNYLAPWSARNRLYVAPGDHLSTTQYDPRTVRVASARGREAEFTLDRTGFELVRHRSAVTDFADAAELDGAYTAESRALVRELTGADEVVSLGWMLRRAARDGDGPNALPALPPAPDVHVDLHTSAIARGYAQVHARSALPAAQAYRRAVYTSLWRTFSPPPQDWPLALCDYRSTDDGEGSPNLLFRVAELPAPERIPDDVDEADAESAASVFVYSPAHRWWYFPGMDEGEALIFKLHDTDRLVAWRAPHTSFHDAGATGAYPRESIELRTVGFFY
jgi:hypothetical protein